MGYECAITFFEKRVQQLQKKSREKRHSCKTAKKSGAKKSSSKKYFSENYAYFLPILTLGERKKGVVLMGD